MNASTIVYEIGDIRQFSSSVKLQAMAVRHLTYLGKEWGKGDASCTTRISLKINIAYPWPDKGSHLAKKNIQDQKLQEDGSRRKGLPHLKQHLSPFFSKAVSGKRAMQSLTVIGYTREQ